MKSKSSQIILFGLLMFLSSPAKAARPCIEPWICATKELRSGYLKENEQVPFRGNIIYYQGLGDSMMNHQPLFMTLTNAGYRVIAFDYLQQGGSTGQLSDMQFKDIASLGNEIWYKYARDLENYPKKTIIGWSTGGLAAYLQAAETKEDVSNLILIAPGIVPNLFIGETNLLKAEINKITLDSLTSARYQNGETDPHIDPIVPDTPLKAISFITDLLWHAHKSRQVTMKPSVQGFVLLSGPSDSYVNGQATAEILYKNASHFTTKIYPKALHEIDNEIREIRQEVYRDILNFLDQVTPK